MFSFLSKKSEIPDPANAPRGRAVPIPTADTHFVNGRPLTAEVPEGYAEAMFGMGCFWGVERIFWKVPGVWLSMVGYAGGFTPNATYQEVCSGQTGHNEVVRVIYDPKLVSYEELLRIFWEGHDPTQGMRQGNDAGTQYRSGIYTYSDAQAATANDSRKVFSQRLSKAGYGAITTEIVPAPEFYFAEDYHQQYLAKTRQVTAGSAAPG